MLMKIRFGSSIPLAIVNKAHQANQTYPFAVSLIESVRAYDRTLEKVKCGNFARNVLNVLFVCDCSAAFSIPPKLFIFFISTICIDWLEIWCKISRHLHRLVCFAYF